MSRKKERSSWDEVSTAREGGEMRWDVNGSEVSTVIGVVSVEMWRRRRREVVASGWRRVVDRDERRESAISAVDLVLLSREKKEANVFFLSDLKNTKANQSEEVVFVVIKRKTDMSTTFRIAKGRFLLTPLSL